MGRIIVTNSGAAEAVLLLGEADKTVGVSGIVAKKGFYFPALKDKQSAGSFMSADYEMVTSKDVRGKGFEPLNSCENRS